MKVSVWTEENNQWNQYSLSIDHQCRDSKQIFGLLVEWSDWNIEEHLITKTTDTGFLLIIEAYINEYRVIVVVDYS
jgi:hypothetical protein